MSTTIATPRPTLLQRSMSARESTCSTGSFDDLLDEAILPLSAREIRQHRQRSMTGRSGLSKMISRQRSSSTESETLNILDSDSDVSSTWSCGGSVASEPRLERSDSSASARSIIVDKLVAEFSGTTVAGKFALETLRKLAKHKRSHHVRQVLSQTPSHVQSLVKILGTGSRVERECALEILYGLAGGSSRDSKSALVAMANAGALKLAVAFALDIINAPVDPSCGSTIRRCLAEVIGLLRSLMMHHDTSPVSETQDDAAQIGTLLRVVLGGVSQHQFSDRIREKSAGLLWIMVMKTSVNDGLPGSVLACIPSLIYLLSSASATAKESAAGALWSLATHPVGKRAIVSCEGIPVLLETLETGSRAAKDSAAGALLHLGHRM